MSKHTPGPWTLLGAGTVSAAGVPSVARVELRFVSANQLKANAQLIAAAPDLLAACQAFLEDWRVCEDTSASGDTVDAIQSAITKATGG